LVVGLLQIVVDHLRVQAGEQRLSPLQARIARIGKALESARHFQALALAASVDYLCFLSGYYIKVGPVSAAPPRNGRALAAHDGGDQRACADELSGGLFGESGDD